MSTELQSEQPTPTGLVDLLVSSTDGRSFQVEASAEAGLRAGDFLAFADEAGTEHLGFVEDVALLSNGQVGAGAVLPGRRGSAPPGLIRSSPARRCSPDQIAEFLAGQPAPMEFARLVSDPAVGVGLHASKLNRHTFWCGQSGSGKTYALGVALEQIMLHTRLPLVILDPNSDFVKLGERREDAPSAEAAELASRDIRVRRSTQGTGEPLQARFLSMPLRSRAAILQIDPLLDADDYNTML